MADEHGPVSVAVTLENSPGGTAKALTGFLRSGIDVGHESETVETTGFGDSFREFTPTGIKKHDDIELTLLFTTTATSGTHAILGTVDDGPQDAGRELIVTVASTAEKYTVDVRLVRYRVVCSLDSIQMVNVLLRPTGAGVWS